MADFSSNVKQKFNLLLSQMSENRWLYVNHPQSDFTRQDTGKLTFSDTMRLIIGMGKSTTNDEISEYFDLDPDRVPSQSAFIQRRSQLSPLAFEHLFRSFLTLFRKQLIPSKGAAFSHVTAAISSTLQMLKFFRTITIPISSTIKAIIICI